MNQTEFPFLCDKAALKEFLLRWLALEEEEDRLREEKRGLKETYQDDIPMRGVLTAVKVVRAKRKLEHHPKEPMKRENQVLLEATVEAYLQEQDTAFPLVAQLTEETRHA